jgi:hypothetical protein
MKKEKYVVLNPEYFSTKHNTYIEQVFTQIEIIPFLVNVYTSKTIYQIIIKPDSFYTHGITSTSVNSLKKKVASIIRGYKQKEKIKWGLA